MKHFFIFSIVFLNLISCNNDVDLFSKAYDDKIVVEITGDENIIISKENIETKRGFKWKSIKRKVLKCVKCEKGYVFSSSFLDNEELTEDYIFNTDCTVYITSKLKKSNSEKYIELILIGDEYIKVTDAKLTIKIDSTWQEIKDDVNDRLNFQEGYELSKWKLGKSKNARILKNEYIFKKDCTIYASSKEVKKKEIILDLVGDTRVKLEHSSLKVVFGTTWLEIKDSHYIASVKAEYGYSLSDWKLENNVDGKNIEDDYIFNRDIRLYIFSIKTVIDGPSNPNTPIDIEIDDLGMITIISEEVDIKGVKIDYTLCNYPKEQNKKLWYGVFEEESITHIAPYKLHQYETTYKLWKEVYDWAILHDYVFENVGRRGCSRNSEETKEEEPVTEVSYRDCLVWCNAYTEKLNHSTSSCIYLESKEGRVLKNAKEEKYGKNLCDNAYIDFTKKGIRLPTEAEWELASRIQVKTKLNAVLYGNVYLTKLNSASGSTLPIPTPNLKEPNIENMNNELMSTTICGKFYNGLKFVHFNPEITKTSSVGSKKANQLGLHDMSGNVAEWCSDLTTDKMFLDSSSSKFAIIRGGSWSSYSYTCSVGYRDARYTDFSIGNIGFRICQTK